MYTFCSSEQEFQVMNLMFSAEGISPEKSYMT